MISEKYNLIQELQQKSEVLVDEKKLSLQGMGDFYGGNNVTRSGMNIKHHKQHVCIDNPEFPMFYDGKENAKGRHSSYYTKTDKRYQIIKIVKKYDELLKGKSYFGLYFLYCKEDDSYKVIERKEVENLTENFGFTYNNEFLDNAEEGEYIPEGVMVSGSTSYDENGNTSIGVNGRILYGVHPAVQDDAIIISKSFAKRMVANNIKSITIPVNENSLLLNLYGDEKEYIGLPNIGTQLKGEIIAATRTIKEAKMFSDLRDEALRHVNLLQADQVYYAEGEVIDINVYCNNKNLKMNKVNKQLIHYYNDARWYYTEIYKICKQILKSGSKNIDKKINMWMRRAMNYLDTEAIWAFNDNTFSNLMVELLVRSREEINIGRKITGRAGNKTVCCSIWDDEDMPYLSEGVLIDEYGVKHPKGIIEKIDLITNPLAIINRTIPEVMIEGSITFIIDKTRKYMATLKDMEEQKEFLFEIISTLNPEQGADVKKLWKTLSDREKKEFIKDAISLNNDGTLRTDNGIYIRYTPFDDDFQIRDAIISIYDKYPNIFTPYNVFIPKPKWGRDIYLTSDNVGYQYILMLKQSGEKGFSVRSSGSISDESLPEKSNSNKLSKSPHSTKPIRFGEYELPHFEVMCNPDDFALITALYRSSVDGRKYMYEAVISEDNEYNIPDSFTSRTSEVLQVYLKSLGVRMSTIIDEDEYIEEPEHRDEIVGYKVGNEVIFCTVADMYYLKKLHKVYKRYLKQHPNHIEDIDEMWDYLYENLPFKKKDLTENVIDLFNNHLESFSQL